MDTTATEENQERTARPTDLKGPEKDLSIDQALFDDTDGRLLAEAGAPGDLSESSQPQVNSKLDECLAKLTELTSAVRDRRTNDEFLEKLQRDSQALVEQFHEREVLRPVLLQLIAIADRCREKTSRLSRFLANHSKNTDGTKRQIVSYLLDSRRADLVEIENILANLGVTPYELPDDQFDRSLQTCIERNHTDQTEMIGKIASRLRPGYRRNAQVIRPECVAVFVQGPVGPQP